MLTKRIELGAFGNLPHTLRKKPYARKPRSRALKFVCGPVLGLIGAIIALTHNVFEFSFMSFIE